MANDLSKRLAVAVRSIQWSYAIFWSPSTTQQGVLEWGEGYYNGDIKTRKTCQAMELKADKIGLQRSEQLRELYESLLEGENDQTKRPSASLSPEDLSDAEWYYLVCMSFVFKHGQGLPGRALANGETIWLCNAQYADGKVFSRSLLAKSASIQTVVCFPYLGGVIELGATELVSEDPNLLQHIKASLLDFSKLVCSEKSSSAPHNADHDIDPGRAKADHEIVDLLDMDNLYSPRDEIKFDHEKFNQLDEDMNEDFGICSADEDSNACEQNHQAEDSFMVDGVNGVASQVQSWHFMDDHDFSHGVQNSINSSDCISEAFANQERAAISLDVVVGVDDDLHYKATVSAILGTSNWLTETKGLHSYKSSFIGWKKSGGLTVTNSDRARIHGNMLKKILFAVPLMHGRNGSHHVKSEKGKNIGKSDNNGRECVVLENGREEENFLVLKSMVPSINEIDKASILNDTIKYLKELEARVEELETCMDSVKCEARPRMRVVEETSDNNNNENRKQQAENVKKSGGWISKRKASDTDMDHDPDINKGLNSDNVQVSIGDELEVVIEIRCPSREFLLVDIMDALNSLNLDAHTLQSSTLQGVLMLTLKSKFRGEAIASAGMIKQTLQRVASSSS